MFQHGALGMTDMKLKAYLDVSASADVQTLERRLVGFADAVGFERITAMTVSPNPAGEPRFTCIGNIPEAYLNIYSNPDISKRCPVMRSLRTSHCPVAYDQSTYVHAGAADLWEEQAPFGYRSGIAVAIHLPADRHYVVGFDREAPLPGCDAQRARLMANLLLLTTMTMDTAFSHLVDQGQNCWQPPKLTARELEVLKWTLQGKSSWVVGEILRVREGTVNFHLRNAMRKLNASSKYVAAMRAVRLGLIAA